MHMYREHAFICILICLERVVDLLQRKKGCLIALCVCVGGLVANIQACRYFSSYHFIINFGVKSFIDCLHTSMTSYISPHITWSRKNKQ